MKKLFLSVMVFIFLTACGGQEIAPTELPFITPKPSSTATVATASSTVTATSTLTKTPQPTIHPTLTLTPLPTYNTKQVIFDYHVTGGLSDFDIFFESDSLRSYSKIIVYDNGQMIIPGKVYKQKVLTPSQVKFFLAKLDEMGFYSLESNQAHNPTDKLYDFGNNYQKVYDAYLYCILTNTDKSRKLCVYEPGISFLIPEMKKIIDYLDKYQPSGMLTYYPDRILLSVQEGRHLYDENSSATAVNWNEKFPSLETLNQKITYVDGNIAKEIYTLFDIVYLPKIFIQNGKEYTVSFTIILPHEKVTNAYK
jgi:hypothetical protein